MKIAHVTAWVESFVEKNMRAIWAAINAILFFVCAQVFVLNENQLCWYFGMSSMKEVWLFSGALLMGFALVFGTVVHDVA